MSGPAPNPATLRALELLRAGTCASPQEAVDHPDVANKITVRAVYKALASQKARAAKVKKKGATSRAATLAVVLPPRAVAPPLTPAAPPLLDVARPVVPDLPADREERARAVRKLFAERGAEHNTIQRLALTWECSVAEVQQAIDDAAKVSAGLEVPKALRLVESRATWTEIRRKALDANDWKSAAMAQAALDKLDGLEGKVGATPAGSYTRAQVVQAMAEIYALLAAWPAAQAALEKKLGGRPQSAKPS